MIDRFSFFLARMVFALAPLPFGSTDIVWLIAWTCLLAVSLLCTSPHRVTTRHATLLLPVLLLACVYGGAIWLQLMQNPLFGHPNPIWHEAADILHIMVPERIAVDVAQPWLTLGSPLCIILAFLCGFIHSLEREQSRRLLKIVAVSCAVYAVYGMVSFAIDPLMLLWREKPAYFESVTGTFVNRNTAATYFGTGAILWFCLCVSELLRQWTGRDVSFEVLVALTRSPPRQLIASAMGLFVCLAALMMTRSRAGILLSICGLVVCGVLFAKRHLTLSRKSLTGIGGAILAGAGFLELAGGSVAYRLGTVGLGDEGRWSTYISTFSIIADHPAWGTGLGTFAEIFPAYRTGELSTMGVWSEAHSTPLELAAEMGVPITTLIILGWVAALVLLVRGSLRRRRDAIYPIAATGIGLLAAAHSLIDFPLQIPGYAIVFAGLAGMGLAQSLSSAPRPSLRRRRERQESRGEVLAAPNHPIARPTGTGISAPVS